MFLNLKRERGYLIAALIGIAVGLVLTAIVVSIKIYAAKPLVLEKATVNVKPIKDDRELDEFLGYLNGTERENVKVLNTPTSINSHSIDSYAKIEVTVSVKNTSKRKAEIGTASVNGIIGENLYLCVCDKSATRADEKDETVDRTYTFFAYRNNKSDEQLMEQFKKMSLVLNVKTNVGALKLSSKLNVDLRELK